jgi:uncharacterized membrane protein
MATLTDAIPRTGDATSRRAAGIVCVAAFLLYAALGVVTHRDLRTNGFDLSVFDYAVWTTVSGGPIGYVPMFGYSLFAQHFMPTLLLLSPLGLVFESPAYLIVVQMFLFAAAGFLLYVLASRYVSAGVALALMIAFLFSRRSFSAGTSAFYIESAEPALIFGSVLACCAGLWRVYYLLLLLALGCKEDVAIYFAAFGATLAMKPDTRRIGAWTIAISVIWLVVALGFWIPQWRAMYQLETANPFIVGRYTVDDNRPMLVTVASRAASLRSLGKIVTIGGGTAFTCFLAPAWAAIALPGMLIDLVADPTTDQAGLIGHYLWPVLPWLFVAAIVGSRRVSVTRFRWFPLFIVVVALVDTPVPGRLVNVSWKMTPPARQVREQLKEIPVGATVVAQPNLIPQLPRRMNIRSLGVYPAGEPGQGDHVLLTTVGDLWPFHDEDIMLKVRDLAADPRYEQLSNGPLFSFRRR